MKRRRETRRKVTRSTAQKRNPGIVSFNRTVIITTSLVVLLIVITGFLNKRTVVRSVAGVSIVRGIFSQATIPLPQLQEVTSYNIYYKQTSDKTFTHAVRNIPANVTSYTISYLRKGVAYQYEVSAVGPGGAEFWFSGVKPLTNLISM